jgi:predicted DCC family thiol-disulfide oxidoreductase YuxK
MNDTTYPLTLYYESACALCNGEMSNLMLRNTEGKLRFVDVSAPGFDSPPPGTTLDDLLELIHAQKADGSVVRGVEVFRLAYRAVGLDWVVAPTDWLLLGGLADRAYPWIARNRHRIPRRLTHLLFETAARRAAQRAAANRCDADGTCRTPSDPHPF